MTTKRIPPKILPVGKRGTTNPLGNILKDLDKTHNHMGKPSKTPSGKKSAKTKAPKRPSRVGDVFVDYPPENEYEIKLRIVDWVDET
jgi:hypothetical protein